MTEGVAGLPRDKTRPPRIAPPAGVVEAGVVAATLDDPMTHDYKRHRHRGSH